MQKLRTASLGHIFTLCTWRKSPSSAEAVCFYLNTQEISDELSVLTVCCLCVIPAVFSIIFQSFFQSEKDAEAQKNERHEHLKVWCRRTEGCIQGGVSYSFQANVCHFVVFF